MKVIHSILTNNDAPKSIFKLSSTCFQAERTSNEIALPYNAALLSFSHRFCAKTTVKTHFMRLKLKERTKMD